MDNNQCPCGSTLAYPECCGLFIDNKLVPQTPEALMRSRYTAYSKANIPYIKTTMKGKPLHGFNDMEVTRWAQQIQWLGLKVVNAYQADSNEQHGFVEFIATYRDATTIQRIHEISEFQRIDSEWFYIDGKQIPNSPPKQKISRNAPCPCGSNKKFKNCHAPK